MGTQQSVQRCNFEDVQHMIQMKTGHLIHTLSEHHQQCLIDNTLDSSHEVEIINKLLHGSKDDMIIIYGKHCNDTSVHKKHEQLCQLGFTNVCMYSGGLFEWLCLQDIYGNDVFPTTSHEIDILKFKPHSCKEKKLLLTND